MFQTGFFGTPALIWTLITSSYFHSETILRGLTGSSVHNCVDNQQAGVNIHILYIPPYDLMSIL